MIRRSSLAFVCLLACVPLQSAHAQSFHSVTVEPFVIITDFPFDQGPVVRDHLVRLGQQFEKDLGLSPLNETVKIYLLKNPETYRKLLLAVMPQLRPGDTQRHGLFLRRQGELSSMFILWSDHVGTSLRHEYVHAALGANVPSPPIWLDEGLACFYEANDTHSSKTRYCQRLEPRIAARGWRPDLARLEGLKNMPEMGPMEYAESWAWVHLLLNGSPESRSLFQAYLANLRQPGSATLSSSLSRGMPDLESVWREHFRNSIK
jgi:hypothetical protein